MPRSRKLRSRVAVAFATFGAVVSLLLSSGLNFAARDVGQRLMDETLRAELDDYMARRARNPRSLPPATASLRGYVGARRLPDPAMPAVLRELRPGLHEIELDGHPFRLAVSDGSEERFYLLFDKSLQLQRERQFLAYTSLGVLVMTLLSAAGGWWLAGRVIAPVTDLAELVAKADPASSRIEHLPHDEVGEALELYLARLYGFIDRERSFTADVSHELRTPVAVIQGALEVLLDDPDLPPALQRRLQRIERAAHDMGLLIPALLLLAREEGGAPCPASTCRVAEVLRDSIDKHRPQAGRTGTEVVVDIRATPVLDAEPVLLAVVVGNLIRNALSFTSAGRITITLEEGELRVVDTGQGMSAEEITHLFQRHYRGANSRGSGIGLSLVKRICDRYGWDIRIESLSGRGTSAVLSFVPTRQKRLDAKTMNS